MQHCIVCSLFLPLCQTIQRTCLTTIYAHIHRICWPKSLFHFWARPLVGPAPLSSLIMLMQQCSSFSNCKRSAKASLIYLLALTSAPNLILALLLTHTGPGPHPGPSLVSNTDRGPIPNSNMDPGPNLGPSLDVLCTHCCYCTLFVIYQCVYPKNI